jgi:hypothetical protein
LYFWYRVPRRPEGTVCGKPTTASWLMTARLKREEKGRADAMDAAARSWMGRLRKLSILSSDDNLKVSGVEVSSDEKRKYRLEK